MNSMAKQSFASLFCLGDTSFDLTATTIDDIVAFDVKDDEGIGRRWWVRNCDVMPH
jgi:hypothetical protein